MGISSDLSDTAYAENLIAMREATKAKKLAEQKAKVTAIATNEKLTNDAGFNEVKTKRVLPNQEFKPFTADEVSNSTISQSAAKEVLAVNKISKSERDILIRTVIGEAAGESKEGQAGVVHTILNRTRRKGFGGSTITEVALKPGAFSAWNGITGYASGEGGNRFVSANQRNSKIYNSIGSVVDRVMAGEIKDPTGGATHYYSPSGMRGGRPPYWWNQEVRKGGGVVTIGGHRFAGNPAKVGDNSQAFAGYDSGKKKGPYSGDVYASAEKVLAEQRAYNSGQDLDDNSSSPSNDYNSNNIFNNYFASLAKKAQSQNLFSFFQNMHNENVDELTRELNSDDTVV